MKEGPIGVIQFARGLVFVALALGAAGTLVEATRIVGREADKGPIDIVA